MTENGFGEWHSTKKLGVAPANPYFWDKAGEEYIKYIKANG